MASPMIALKGPLMNKKDYAANFPLKHAQKDMRFALALGDKVCWDGRQNRLEQPIWCYYYYYYNYHNYYYYYFLNYFYYYFFNNNNYY